MRGGEGFRPVDPTQIQEPLLQHVCTLFAGTRLVAHRKGEYLKSCSSPSILDRTPSVNPTCPHVRTRSQTVGSIPDSPARAIYARLCVES